MTHHEMTEVNEEMQLCVLGVILVFRFKTEELQWTS